MVCLTFGTFSHGLLSRCGDRQCMIKTPTLLRLVNLVLLLPISGKIHFFYLVHYGLVQVSLVHYYGLVHFDICTAPPPPSSAVNRPTLTPSLSLPSHQFAGYGILWYKSMLQKGTKGYKRVQNGIPSLSPTNLLPICTSTAIFVSPFSQTSIISTRSYKDRSRNV